MDKTKPKSFVISKKSVWLAYQRVKANRGGCGVDKMSLKDFEDNLQEQKSRELLYLSKNHLQRIVQDCYC